jgi:HK97 family phage portal protein
MSRWLELSRNDRGKLRIEFRSASSSLASPAQWLTDSLGGGPTMSGERVTQSSAMGLTGVFAAVYKLSEVVGALPLKVYRVVGDDGREEARAHRAWNMLHDKPNPYTVAHVFWGTVVAQLALGGNAYLLKERDPFGVVESLWLLDPSKIEVELNSRGDRRYWFTGGNAIRKLIPIDDLTHIVGFSLDGIMGCSRITYCRQRFGSALARDRYEGAFYQGGAKNPFAIQYPGRLGPDGLKNMRESFTEQHAGAGKMHRPPILEEGATIAQMGMSLADMQFVENAQLSLTEIAVLFDLPPGELGGMHGGSLEYQTEELNQIRLARACLPYTSRIAKTLSADPGILPQNVMYAEFTLEALMRPDAKTRIEYWEKLKAMGVVDEAYIASRENLPAPPPPKPSPIPPVNQPGNGNGNVDPSALAAMMAANG